MTTGLDAWVRPDEQCVALTRDYRLVQRLRGHRYSVDDMLVAHLACTRASRPDRILDLGCGIGSVLLMVGWAHPSAELIGIEAQPEHVDLARRNLVLNGRDLRARVVAGDLRDADLVGSLGVFDLVTGSPPYFDPRSSTVASDTQRAYSLWELRGGIEEYAQAASRALSVDGLFVTCAPATPEQRARNAIEGAGLVVRSLRRVIPRTAKKPFLTLLVCGRRGDTAPTVEPDLVLRDSDGSRSAEHVAIRDWFGIERAPK